MVENTFFTQAEKTQLGILYRKLYQSAGDSITKTHISKLKKYITAGAVEQKLKRNNFGINPIIRDLNTALIVSEEIGMKGACLVGIMLH